MSSHPDAVFVLPGAQHDRLDRDFHYLSGSEEKNAILVLAPSANGFETILFAREKDAHHELWHGWMPGLARLQEIVQADRALPIEEFWNLLPELLALSERVFYRLGADASRDLRLIEALETARRKRGRRAAGHASIEDPRAPIGELRIRKDAGEIARMREAARISAKAHLEAMELARPGMSEADIAAILEHRFRREGAERRAYDTIVGSGRNATCLHYTECRSGLREGELLLIDAGAEFQYYTSDITRTLPVGARFAPLQREVYETVLRAQKAALELARPGNTLVEIHEVAKQVIQEFASTKGWETSAIFPHQTSHWLGLDVHDTGKHDRNGAPRKLETGMCFTVEPGIYLQDAGLGVRIEDDVLITEDGCEILTASVPKEIEEIEEIREKGLRS